MVKKILITGGAGFVGANLTRLLVQEGYQITILDNLSSGAGNQYISELPIKLFKGDILDTQIIKKAVTGQDAVIHLAAQTGVPGSLKDPKYDCQVNVIGTLNILEASRHADIKRFIFASSNAPLGKQTPPATEDKAPLPISPYGASKLAGEAYCLAYNGSWGLGTVILRFANLYGPYSAHKNSVVAKFFKDVLADGHLTIDGDGRQTRDFIYVGDLCHAVHLALESEVSGELFQIATGVETSISSLAKLIQITANQTLNIHHGPARQGDIDKNYSAVQKAKRQLGWEPQISLNQGLSLTWKWIKAYQTKTFQEKS